MYSFIEYQQSAIRTFGGDNNRLNFREKVNLCALGLSGESGEVTDLIKKYHYHGKPFDTEKLVKEMGDVLWYLSALCETLGVSLSDVAKKNIKKLEERYPNGFSHDASNNRIS